MQIMNDAQKQALRWVLIEACALHADRALDIADEAAERADLELLIALLEQHGENVDSIRCWLKPAK